MAALAHGDLVGDGYQLRGQTISLVGSCSTRDTHVPLTLRRAFEVVRQTGPESYLAVRIASDPLVPNVELPAENAALSPAPEVPPWRLCGNTYAIHCWSKAGLFKKQVKRIIRRAQAWQASSFPPHPNLARLHHIYETSDLILLVVEEIACRNAQSLREFLLDHRGYFVRYMNFISEVFMQVSVAFAACDTIPLECEITLDHFVVIRDNFEVPRHFIVKLAYVDVRREWDSAKLHSFAPIDYDRENACQNPSSRFVLPHRCDTKPEERRNWYEGCLYSRLLHPAFEGALGLLLLELLHPIVDPLRSALTPYTYPDRPFRVAHSCDHELSCFRSFVLDVLSSVAEYLEPEIDPASAEMFDWTMQNFAKTVYDLEEAIEAGAPLSATDSAGSSTQPSPAGSELRHFRWAAQEQALHPLTERCLRLGVEVYRLTSDCSARILPLVNERQAHLLADFLLHSMPGISGSTGMRCVHNARKLVRKLYDKAGTLPSVVSLNNITPISLEPVGGGGFSDVFKGDYTEDSESGMKKTVALKRIRLHVSGKDTVTITRRFRREILVMYMITILKPPNIVPFLGLESDLWPNHLPCIVTPWVENGTVLDYMKKCLHLATDELFRGLFEGIGNGLLFLHDQDVIHGDLCGRNILVDEHGVARLADFGLSWFIDATRRTMTNEAGSIRWMAPELIDPNIKFERTCASDMYALGCTFLEISTGQPPFCELENEAAVMRRLLEGFRPSKSCKTSRPFWRGVSDWQWDLIKQAWRTRPEKRPDARSVVMILRSLAGRV